MAMFIKFGKKNYLWVFLIYRKKEKGKLIVEGSLNLIVG